MSQRSRVGCYDIYQRAAQFRNRFDVIFLFDDLEHITDQIGNFRSIPEAVTDEMPRTANDERTPASEGDRYAGEDSRCFPPESRQEKGPEVRTGPLVESETKQLRWSYQLNFRANWNCRAS